MISQIRRFFMVAPLSTRAAAFHVPVFRLNVELFFQFSWTLFASTGRLSSTFMVANVQTSTSKRGNLYIRHLDGSIYLNPQSRQGLLTADVLM
jgi:hypothetical protein